MRQQQNLWCLTLGVWKSGQLLGSEFHYFRPRSRSHVEGKHSPNGLRSRLAANIFGDDSHFQDFVDRVFQLAFRHLVTGNAAVDVPIR